MKKYQCENTAYEDGERCTLPAYYRKNGQRLCPVHFKEIIDEEISNDKNEKAIADGEARYRQSVLADEI